MVFHIGGGSPKFDPTPLPSHGDSQAPLFVDAGALRDALQAEFPDATFVEGTKDRRHRDDLRICTEIKGPP